MPPEREMVLHEQRTVSNLGLTSQISSPVSTNEDVSEITELEMKGVTKISNSMAQPIPMVGTIHLRMVPKTKKHLVN